MKSNLCRGVCTLLVILAPSCSRSRKPAVLPTPTSPAGVAQARSAEPASAMQSPNISQSGTAPATWDVENPPGPRHDVPIDTDEGTWMNVDVSPDGKIIAFDLLGDLYTVPISGGEARELTHGLAWDMQPRFSPDGRTLAFTSDRGGGDNIWTLSTTGDGLRQITHEDFRLLNSPTWTPDGQYIAARKHFTGTRSLGSGELWLFHILGGKGVPLTEKPNQQKDVGEPAFSSDGRFVYFSQDTTAGDTFEYNKNPYAGIYAIRRIDRHEGIIDTFIEGPGGAIRPTPSPDGQMLAFIRRDGQHTVLMVHNVSSGKERIIDGNLDRDMQETWAIHGVYPNIAWTPDSRELVYWRGGKIYRTDVSTTKSITVPFHVKGTRTVLTALRSPQTAHPEQFHTRMLRGVQVSPNGHQVVFQALGQLWIREIAGTQVRRLTRDLDVFEFQPQFSRDGKYVVYVAYDDSQLGSIRVASVASGASRLVTATPGHYREPTFSPDGKSIVFRKSVGEQLLSRQYSHDPGLYIVAATGGAPTRISRTGRAPQFGRDSDRVFFADQDEDKDQAISVLRSISTSGTNLLTHLKSNGATEFAIAPNGRWVAFREGYQAYAAPFPETGARPIEIGPKAEGIPTFKLSTDAGQYVHFSQGSKQVHWTSGPTLFSVSMADAIAVQKQNDEATTVPARSLDIGFDVRSDAPKGTIALVGGKIVTMRGDQVIDNGVVVISGNRIAAVGPRTQVQIPKDATLFDVTGTTIIPGIVDVHAHGPQAEEGITPRHNWLHDATLAFGVTTIHDPSNDTSEIFAASELARAGQLVAPRIFSTGTVLYGAQTPYMAVVEDLDGARSHLRRMQAVGAFTVKSYNQPRRSQRQQIVAAARELGMMVVPEGGSLFQHNMTMVVDGHSGVEHALPVANAYDDVVQLWSATQVGYTPTLVVAYGGLWGENYWYAHSNVYAHPRLRRFVPPEELDARARRRLLASAGDWNHIAVARLANKLHRAGVHVQLGAHGQREGLAAHWELWMLVQGGMTAHEALRVGTVESAEYLGLERDLGSIEPGKLADLAVISGDVLSNIRRSEDVRFTVINGRVYDAATMDELAPRKRAYRPLPWQRP